MNGGGEGPEANRQWGVRSGTKKQRSEKEESERLKVNDWRWRNGMSMGNVVEPAIHRSRDGVGEPISCSRALTAQTWPD